MHVPTLAGVKWSAAPESDLAPVTPPWRTLVLVCSKCHGARKGPSPKDVRKLLKQELGKPDDLRIAEVECLKLCPDDAVTVCVVAAGGAPQVCLVRSDADADALLKRLERRG